MRIQFRLLSILLLSVASVAMPAPKDSIQARSQPREQAAAGLEVNRRGPDDADSLEVWEYKDTFEPGTGE
ncbi:MAG: hypothetical protein ALECFALPRED_000840 [Alectoria fallacina]|uniref:Uncharacterized protein n=1 Tax=Alectoria fallacina TaxID=1903189 RepID=A0A8H3F840_9LECA|nr:MAG: hypothetical protein ALECFALPRED_000840 [Alectoria fallacina]